MRAFNLGQAGVCIAHAAPETSCSWDPLDEVNFEATFERYVAEKSASCGVASLIGKFRWASTSNYSRPDEIPALLIERGVLARAIVVLSRGSRWRCVHADAVAAVFVAAPFAETHRLADVKASIKPAQRKPSTLRAAGWIEPEAIGWRVRYAHHRRPSFRAQVRVCFRRDGHRRLRTTSRSIPRHCQPGSSTPFLEAPAEKATDWRCVRQASAAG